MLGWQGRIFVYLRHQQEALTAKSFKCDCPAIVALRLPDEIDDPLTAGHCQPDRVENQIW
jgi:hypothetical protein